jgi:hypothetical protein
MEQDGCSEDFSGLYVCSCKRQFCNDFAIASVPVDTMTDLRNAYHLWNGKVPTRGRHLIPMPVARQMLKDQLESEKKPAKDQAAKPVSLAAKLTKQSLKKTLKAQAEEDVAGRYPGGSFVPASIRAGPYAYGPPEARYNPTTGNPQGLQFSKASKAAISTIGKAIEQVVNPEARPGNKYVSPVLDNNGVPVNFVGLASKPYEPETAFRRAPSIPRVDTEKREQNQKLATELELKPIDMNFKENKQYLRPITIPGLSESTHSSGSHQGSGSQQQQSTGINTVGGAAVVNVGELVASLAANNKMPRYSTANSVPNIAVVVVPSMMASQPAQAKPEDSKEAKKTDIQEAIRYVPIEVPAPPKKQPAGFKSVLKSAVDKLLT